jgi:hypothetical protein
MDENIQQQVSADSSQTSGNPGLVKVVSVLYFIYAAGLIFLLVKLISAVIVKGKLITGYVVLMVILLILGILVVMVGIGLLKSKGWAKVIAIIFSIVLALYSIFSNFLSRLEISLFGFGVAVPNILGIVLIVINIAIVAYLLFSKKVKETFD